MCASLFFVLLGFLTTATVETFFFFAIFLEDTIGRGFRAGSEGVD